MYNNQYVIWLFVGISSVLVSQTTSEQRTYVYCGDGRLCPTYSNCIDNDCCECDQGYIWVNSECRVQCGYPNSPCPSKSYCQLSSSGQYCVCNFGYTWRGGQCRKTCRWDITCPHNSECGDNGYCICERGYEWLAGYCDLDECSSSHRCHQNALCNNTVGSYYCTCKSGYTGNGWTCTDIDECLETSTCDSTAVCQNYPGGYTCTCLSGYSRNGRICTDINECSDSSTCDRTAVCQNYPGGYTCTCRNGYSGNGRICTDINECSDSSTCDRAAVCQNYPGGYTCTCRSGYSGNGRICTDIDECTEPSPCDRAAICDNYPGSYNCTCLSGFSGNGTFCIDIDECSDRKPCDRDAFCENYPGGYNCTCLTGYSGNGTICTGAQVMGPDALAASPGAIAGGVIGACAVLIVIVVLVVVMTRRRRKENTDVDVPKSPPRPMYENVRMCSGVSTTGNTATVVSPDVDGSHNELYHNNLIKERKKTQLNQTNGKSDENVYITYNDGNNGEYGGSHYDKLWETKIEQPSPNFTEERSNGDVQVNLTTDVQISKGAEVYGYDHLKRGTSQPGDNTGHHQEGEAYGHLYGADIDNWDTENTDIDNEQSNTNNVYSLAKNVGKD